VSESRPPRAGAALLTAAVLIASAAGGMLFYRLAAPERAKLYPLAQPGLPPAAGTTGPAPSSSGMRIPAELPEVELPSPDGATRHLSEWQGKSLLINFWATWCEPCRREIPLLKTLRSERRREGLEVVGIAVDSPDAVQKYIARHGIDYPVLVGEQGGLAAASAFGMEPVLPFSVFADHLGRVVTLKVGELHRDEADFILDRVREVDAGKLELAAARSAISAEIARLAAARARQVGGATG